MNLAPAGAVVQAWVTDMKKSVVFKCVNGSGAGKARAWVAMCLLLWCDHPQQRMTYARRPRVLKNRMVLEHIWCQWLRRIQLSDVMCCVVRGQLQHHRRPDARALRN